MGTDRASAQREALVDLIKDARRERLDAFEFADRLLGAGWGRTAAAPEYERHERLRAAVADAYREGWNDRGGCMTDDDVALFLSDWEQSEACRAWTAERRSSTTPPTLDASNPSGATEPKAREVDTHGH